MNRLLLWVALALSGCSALVPLRQEGQNVLIAIVGNPGAMKDYQFLGNVDCYAIAAPSHDDNVTSCKNDLRNQAGKKGGQLIVIESQEKGGRYCKVCVRMKGRVYRKREVK